MDHTEQNGKDAVADSQAASGVARDKLMDGLKNAIGEAESWLQDSVEHEGKPASEARARFDDTLRTARTDLRKLEDSVVGYSRDAAKSADAYVHDNPWQAVTLSATLGVLVGLLIARR